MRKARKGFILKLKNSFKFFQFFFILFCFLSSFTQAAYIMKVKDDIVLVNMEGGDAKVGEIYYIVDLNARKRGLTKILKAKNKKAIGKFVGEANPGWDLFLRKDISHTSQQKVQEKKNKNIDVGLDENQILKKPTTYSRYRFELKNYIGGYVIGFKDKLEARNDKLEGYNFGVSGFFNYSFHKSFSLRPEVGYVRFNLDSENGHQIKAHYVKAGLTTMFMFPVSYFRFWVGANSYVYFPFSKESNLIDEESISTTIVYGFSAGFEYVDPKGRFIIPVAIDGSLFPSSSNIDSSRIGLKIGFGLYF